jgi:RHS repeat-associated protein
MFFNILIHNIKHHPFGMVMPSRTFEHANGYRYGFNGKENDDDIVGTGQGTQDYGMRIYNPSLGKFLSVDPMTKSYSELTPYQFASNTPIRAIDLDGLEKVDYQDKRVDGVTVQIDISKTRTADGSLQQSTTTTDRVADANGNITPPVTLGTISQVTANVQSNLQQEQAVSPSANNAITQGTTGNPASGGTSTSANIENQFNQTWSEGSNTGQQPAFGAPVVQSMQNGNQFVNTNPNNVSRVLILTNGTAASTANAVTQVAVIQNAFPNVRVAIASAPNLINNNNLNAVRIMFNPTADATLVLPQRNNVPQAVFPNITNWVQPFNSPLLATPPTNPLRR